MSTKERSANAPTIPVLRLLPRLIRDPLGTLGAVSRSAGGRVVRLDGGLFRPYLLTHPEHVQHVLVDRASSYLRTGKLWTQLQRLEGTGLAGEGAAWRASRALYQPAFTARNIRTVTARMAAAIADAVDELGERAAGRPIDAGVEMTRIVHRALLAAFWGDRITVAETERLGAAITTAVNSIGPRLILPFVPQAVPLPGDRAFARAVRTVDEVIYPLVRQARLQPDSDDLLSIAVTARGKDGRGLTDRQIRDDVVALFVGGTEATALVLTWLWVILDTQPAVAAALYDEIDGLTDEPYQDQLDRLTYTDLVLREVMRLYPPSWLLPRTVAEDDVIDGVRIPAGATV
ncbi:MAG TPA: cytochrome P450, partial [Kribbellaceae bacterium]